MITEQQAAERGFTRPILADGGPYSLELLIRDDADLDGEFEAYDLNEHDLLRVRGWLFSIEELAL